MRTKVFLLPVVGLPLLFAACNSGRYKQLKVETKAESPAASSENAYGADSTKFESGLIGEDKQLPNANYADDQLKKRPRQVVAVPNPDWDRKIVKTADLDLNVKNFRVFTGRLHAAVNQWGGYIAQEQEQTHAGDLENTVTIRVPVDHFEDLMAALPADSDKLIEKKVSSEDVSTEVVDTKSRLETKKEARERYMELLKQAHSMKDIISLQSEIDDIQEDMDQATGGSPGWGIRRHTAPFIFISTKCSIPPCKGINHPRSFAG